jgi:hypothetical protein
MVHYLAKLFKFKIMLYPMRNQQQIFTVNFITFAIKKLIPQ